MELVEAIRQLVPLQVRIPNPRKPFELLVHCAAEVFLVETDCGPAVVWLNPFWCSRTDIPVCHIAYATPRANSDAERWVDNDPRFGPRCLAYLKPFVIERLHVTSPAWKDHKAWQSWRGIKGKDCGRQTAWRRVEAEFGDILSSRVA